MKHGLKHKALILLGIALIIGLTFLLKLFIIGEPVDGVQIVFVTSAHGQTLDLQVDTLESAMALRGWKQQQDGGSLYINARKVLVSPIFHEGHYETSIDLETVETIILGGKVILAGNESETIY